MRANYAARPMSPPPENDQYCKQAMTQLAEASPERAVTEQPGALELDNHLGIRHASALFTTMYAASRALVLAAVGEAGTAQFVESTTTYPFIPLGPVTSTAEPEGEGWDSLGAELEGGRAVELRTAVTSANEDGRTVSTLGATWRVEPSGAAAGG